MNQEFIKASTDEELNELIKTSEKRLDYLYDRKQRPEQQRNSSTIDTNIEYWTTCLDAAVDELRKRTKWDES